MDDSRYCVNCGSETTHYYVIKTNMTFVMGSCGEQEKIERETIICRHCVTEKAQKGGKFDRTKGGIDFALWGPGENSGAAETP